MYIPIIGKGNMAHGSTYARCCRDIGPRDESWQPCVFAIRIIFFIEWRAYDHARVEVMSLEDLTVAKPVSLFTHYLLFCGVENGLLSGCSLVLSLGSAVEWTRLRAQWFRPPSLSHVPAWSYRIPSRSAWGIRIRTHFAVQGRNR